MNRANRPQQPRIPGSSYASRALSRAGDGSTLSLDFTAMGGVLDSRITFSRADADARATFINSLGNVETVATAQAPRFDYTPTTLVARGLLLEAPATNVALRSEEFTSGFWGYNATARTVESSDVNPTGSTGSISVAPSSNGGSRYVGAFATGLTTTSFYTFSIWLKAKGTAAAEFILFNSAGSISSGITILSQPSGGSATVSNSPGIVPRISGLSSSGWTRIAVTTTAALGGTGAGNFFLYPSNTSASTTADSIYVWGAQIEASSLASSYIKTTTAAVTRAADTAIIAAGSNFSSWYTGGTTGTFVSNWYSRASSATARTVIATNDQITKHLHMYQTASALTLRLADFNAAATVTTANSMTANALTKGAFSYNGTATSLCLNGGTVATGTLAFSADPTWLSIGGPSTNGTSITATDVMLNNSIRSIKYFPARLSDGQIQGLTT